METKRQIPKRFEKWFTKLQGAKIPVRVSFFIIGIASTIWFLVRVIPKPSRAGYPCIKAAAPFMSSFVIYLLTLAGSSLLLKRARRFFFQSKYLAAAGLLVAGVAVFVISSNIYKLDTQAADGTDPEDFIPNLPFGEGQGIFPGRVVWAWNPDATDENCTNTMDDPVRGEDGYFLPKNNNQEVIDKMFADAIIDISGATSVSKGWNNLFSHFNEKKGKEATGYQAGQTVFVKINQGGGGWLTNDDDLSFKVLNWTKKYYGMAETSPAVVISLLDQLVNEYDIPQENIYVGDPIAHIYKHNYDQMVAAFPNVKYVDKDHADLGRTKLSVSADPAIYWSDKGDKMPDALVDYLYAEMENADYLFNIAALKAHARAGITLTTKNHFGSHTRDGASHLHPALIAPENDEPVNTTYGQYRVLTDIMGHEKLGGNTVLFIVDGLWGGTEAVETPVKWNSAPFNGDWPNSLLISQDQVALESVCFDFLRNEFTEASGPAKARPWMGAVDDHLHQAADSKFWPEGITYDPENDGTPIGSLGAHEHWNNKTDKQYSRNLGYDYGIELVSTDRSMVDNTVIAIETEIVPVIDGVGDDACWDAARWYGIDETWITWGEEIDSSDYFGRYKITWSQEENLMYYLVEITDDAFVDGYVYPNDGYPDFDIVEIFIDEDKSGGLHVFDNNATWGQNSENAFSYHIAVNAPADGETESSFVVCDIDGTGWGDKTIPDYANHFPELTMRKEGNKFIYEFSMAVYDDTYNHSSTEDSRVELTPDKLMGMSLAYCDNDTPGTERDNFFGSVWVPEEAYNDHWKNADGYGSLRLYADGVVLNHEVQTTGSIDDYEILELNTSYEVYNDVASLFYDPDGDTLEHSLEYNTDVLEVTIENNSIFVKAISIFTGTKPVTIKASDGEFEASYEFMVNLKTTSIETYLYSNQQIQCYPNPFASTITVKIDNSKEWSENMNISVYNLSGKLLVSKNYDFITDNQFFIDLSSIESGVYILKLEDERGKSEMVRITKL
jgi:hypothetical protein